MFYLIRVLAAIQIGLPQIMGQQKFRMKFPYRFCSSPPVPLPHMLSLQLEPTPLAYQEVETSGAEILLKLGEKYKNS